MSGVRQAESVAVLREVLAGVPDLVADFKAAIWEKFRFYI
jgi:hypothetical protein